MMKICAKLNAFAHQNALIEESTEDELLKCLENERQTFAKLAVTDRQANYLAEIKSQYERYMSKAMGSRYTAEDVPKLREKLYTLPVKGHEIENAVNEYEQSIRRVILSRKKRFSLLDSLNELLVGKEKVLTALLNK